MTVKRRMFVTELGIHLNALPEDIRERCELVLGEESCRLEEADLSDRLKGAEGLLFSSRDPITRRVLEAADCLRVAIKFGARPTNLDFDAALEHGIAVGWTPGANVQSVAEYTLFLAIAALRHVDRALETFAAAGWRSPSHIGSELAGKIIGIIGLGEIGQAVARFFSALDAHIIAFDPHQHKETFSRVGADDIELKDLFLRSDIITLHCTLTPETTGIIGDKALSMVKPTAVLVNTARGGLIDERALVNALESGRLAAAGLDVFATEPLPKDHPFRTTRGIIATPHVAARTLEAIQRERFWAIRGALAFLEGSPLEHVHILMPEHPKRKKYKKDP